ncbi:serine protease [Undibacterium sp. CY7W]|uniref:Serine protease n=1 Tax=Undibacterium rugosum TaxID=2762291 RepID=A0A923KZ24_9BURK|nr:S1C family serine protease [Undibacterium rugosum]MBC3934296.1 serine protease [Undibacterium rugosum]
MRFTVHRAVCLSLLCTHAVFGNQASAESPDKLYARLAPSVWRVFSFDKAGKAMSQGSAVVTGKGVLLTNCHVISKAAKIVLNQQNQNFPAQLEHIDIERDLCQLRAADLPAVAVPVGDASQLVVGQRVYTIGNPVNMEQTLSDGLVSALRRDKENQLSLIQISAPISHGSSGGGLFDEKGNLVGITSAGIDAAQNLNFAIPINWVKELPVRSQAALERYRTGNNAQSTAQNTVPKPAATIAVVSPPVGSGSSPSPGPRPVVTGPELNEILKRPTPVVESGFADINDIAKLDQFGVRKGYENFLKADMPRAFAIVEGGTGWWISFGSKPKNPASSPDPRQRVVKDCEERYQKPCYLYAIDDQVVFKPSRDIAAYTGATPLPPASGFASISDISKLEKFGVRVGYEVFLNKPFPRAFAITADGKSYLSNGTNPKNPESSPEPHVRILGECERYYQRSCYLYAVNGIVVFRPPKELQSAN